MTAFDRIWDAIEKLLVEMETMAGELPSMDFVAIKADLANVEQDDEALDAVLGLLVLVAASYGAAIGPIGVAMALVEALATLDAG